MPVVICSIDLIDTQWNVNRSEDIYKMYMSKDLIDTQWNVNEELGTWDLTWYRRFNRYIVECKSTYAKIFDELKAI